MLLCQLVLVRAPQPSCIQTGMLRDHEHVEMASLRKVNFPAATGWREWIYLLKRAFEAAANQPADQPGNQSQRSGAVSDVFIRQMQQANLAAGLQTRHLASLGILQQETPAAQHAQQAAVASSKPAVEEEKVQPFLDVQKAVQASPSQVDMQQATMASAESAAHHTQPQHSAAQSNRTSSDAPQSQLRSSHGAPSHDTGHPQLHPAFATAAAANRFPTLGELETCSMSPDELVAMAREFNGLMIAKAQLDPAFIQGRYLSLKKLLAKVKPFWQTTPGSDATSV